MSGIAPTTLISATQAGLTGRLPLEDAAPTASFNWGGAMDVAGRAIGAIGMLYAGFSQAKGFKRQAKAVDQEALDVRQLGLWQAERLNEETRRTLATQRQLFGQAGVTLEGAPTDLQVATRRAAVLDRLTLAYNNSRQVAALRSQAAELRRAARAAKTGGIIGAVGQLL